jgi:hypothetical protein
VNEIVEWPVPTAVAGGALAVGLIVGLLAR